MLTTAGFERIEVRIKPESRDPIKSWAPGQKAESYVASADIMAKEPGPA